MTRNNHQSHDHLAKQLRTMGHPERLHILLHLQQGECSLNELAELTTLDSITLGNHLHKMRQLGMVDYTRFHRIVQYRIISPFVQQSLACVIQQLAPE